jgi:hypothetical protein
MTDQAQPSLPPSRRWWLLVPILAAILIGAAAAIVLFVRKPQSQTPALDAELTVRITSADRRKEQVAIDESGALPVRAGDRMVLELWLSQPAYCYLLWLDSQGRVVPLYPWNIDDMEVTDANASPPVSRKGVQIVASPLTIGKGWQFGNSRGLETVLLLARRTPLPAEVKLGELLGGLPLTPMRGPEEVASLRFDQGQANPTTLLAQNRGSEAEAREVDAPLLQRLARLREHFEIVRALRFAHEGE